MAKKQATLLHLDAMLRDASERWDLQWGIEVTTGDDYCWGLEVRLTPPRQTGNADVSTVLMVGGGMNFNDCAERIIPDVVEQLEKMKPQNGGDYGKKERKAAD